MPSLPRVAIVPSADKYLTSRVRVVLEERFGRLIDLERDTIEIYLNESVFAIFIVMDSTPLPELQGFDDGLLLIAVTTGDQEAEHLRKISKVSHPDLKLNIITIGELADLVQSIVIPPEPPFEHAGVASGDFAVAFDSRLSPDQIIATLTAFATYYRASGGVGLPADFESQQAVREDAYV